MSPCCPRLSFSGVRVTAMLAALGVLAIGCGDDGARQPRGGAPGGGSAGGDASCLRHLKEKRVAVVTAPPTRGIETPVEVVGTLGGLRLSPRGKRAALMDCQLARA